MRWSANGWIIGLAAAGTMLTAAPADAQGGILGRMRERAKNRIEQKVGSAVDRAVDAAVDGGSRDPAEVAAGSTGLTGPGALVNFDFVPGSRVIFSEDFSGTDVGDFPRRLEILSGNGEVAEWQGRRWLRASGDLKFAVPLPEVLPERFTLEFDYYGSSGNKGRIFFVDEASYYRGGKAMANWVSHQAGVETYNGPSSMGAPGEALAGRIYPVRIMADGKHVKMYVGGTRVANAPNLDLGRSRKIVFQIPANAAPGAFVGNLRIAAGGRDLYDALAAEGRVATQGILFDTGSDRIRPESAPTLEEIAGMLRQHPGLRLRIEGHTDGMGDARSNQVLSEKRAAAVRSTLVREHGIDAARLESRGLGESKPAASNDSPEGRQQNRRVELVRL